MHSEADTDSGSSPEARALAGRSVVVTRTRSQASKLTQQLEHHGATVHEVPMIRLDGPTDGGAGLAAAVADLDSFAWCVLSSPNGAARFVQAVHDAGRTLSQAGPAVATVGPATAAVIEEAGGTVNLVASRHVAEGLVADFPSSPDGHAQGRRVLLPQAEVARPTLADGLRERGWICDVVAAYQTVPADLSPTAVETIRGADIVTFTSSSTVTNFCAAVGVAATPPMVASIGPVTSATAHELGLHVHVEADPHTIEGLVLALIEAHR